MALTRSFKETVQARAQRDPEFRAALFQEALECMLCGEADIGRAIMRDYINATVGFETLSAATGTPAKSLMRMFSPKGNPSARSLFTVISHLSESTGLCLRFETVAK